MTLPRNTDPDLWAALSAFLGGLSTTAVQLKTEGPLGCESSVAVLTNSSTSNPLGVPQRDGIKSSHVYAVLPSFKNTRWIIPLENPNWAMDGMQVYVPYGRRARLLKSILLGVIKTGWTGWARRRILIAAKEPLPLEALVGEVTGEHHPFFALSLGAPGRYRKLTIQVMGSDGEILGYIKVPLTEAARERVRLEAAMLERLREVAILRSHIPRVLYAGECGDRTILFQSAGPSCPGPVQFGILHERFLQSLWSIQRIEKPGHELVEAVASRWQKAESILEPGLRALGAWALERAGRELRGTTISCGFSHGDFAPWNSRIEDGRLFLFDWESAGEEVPNWWDGFHFHVQVASLLNRHSGRDCSLGSASGHGAIFLLYLLDSACQLLEEAPQCQSGINYRKRVLQRTLS